MAALGRVDDRLLPFPGGPSFQAPEARRTATPNGDEVDLPLVNPQPSVTPALLKRRNSQTPWFRRTIEVVHVPRLFATRRFSSARQCPSPTRPSQAADPPP